MLETERITCETQQSIYEYMAVQNYDLKGFSDAFLCSDFCRRAFDTIYSRFQWHTVGENADFFMQEIGSQLKKLDNGCWFEPEEAGWLGFTYRHLYIETKVPSAQLVKIYPFERLLENYYGLHTIDSNNAIGILIDNHKKEIWNEDRLLQMGFYEKGVSVREKSFSFSIPLDVKEAISELIRACNSSATVDIGMGKLYQSINRNLNNGITPEQAEALRTYYMFGGMYNNGKPKLS